MTTLISIQDAEEIFVEAILKVRSDGWTIVDYIAIDWREKRCCPIGAIFVVHKDVPSKSIFGQLPIGFVSGYSGKPKQTSELPDWYALGCKLRKRFPPSDKR